MGYLFIKRERYIRGYRFRERFGLDVLRERDRDWEFRGLERERERGILGARGLYIRVLGFREIYWRLGVYG